MYVRTYLVQPAGQHAGMCLCSCCASPALLLRDHVLGSRTTCQVSSGLSQRLAGVQCAGVDKNTPGCQRGTCVASRERTCASGRAAHSIWHMHACASAHATHRGAVHGRLQLPPAPAQAAEHVTCMQRSSCALSRSSCCFAALQRSRVPTRNAPCSRDISATACKGCCMTHMPGSALPGAAAALAADLQTHRAMWVPAAEVAHQLLRSARHLRHSKCVRIG